MEAEDYNAFLDSLVIKEGKLICADNKILWKYAENEIIRSIGFIVSTRYENSICLTGKRNLKYGELCMKKFINGHECRKHNATDVCDNEQCGMSFYAN